MTGVDSCGSWKKFFFLTASLSPWVGLLIFSFICFTCKSIVNNQRKSSVIVISIIINAHYHLLPGRLYEVSANRQLCGVDPELARVLLHNLIRALMRIISIVIAVTIDITVNVVIILMMLTWTVSSKSSKSHSMLLNEFLNSVVAHSCSSPRLVMVMIIIINDDVNDADADDNNNHTCHLLLPIFHRVLSSWWGLASPHCVSQNRHCDDRDNDQDDDDSDSDDDHGEMNWNHTGWHYNESITKLQIAQQSSLESKSEFCDSLGTYSLTTKKGSSSDILINRSSSNVEDFFRNRWGHKNRLLISSAFPLGPKSTEFPPLAGLLNSGCVVSVVAAALRSSTLPPPRFFSHQLILFWGEVVHD